MRYVDFKIVLVWNYCFFIYVFCLQVVEYGLFVKYCKVEVYLLELKFCENSDFINVLSCYFSKVDIIGKYLGWGFRYLVRECREYCG